jgi:hypothetical protein
VLASLVFCVNLAHILQRGWDPNKCREHALPLHRTQSSDAWLRHPAQRTIFPYIVALGPRLAD